MSAAQLVLAVPSRPALVAPQRALLTDPEDLSQAAKRLDTIQMVLSYRQDPRRYGLLRLQNRKPVSSFSRMVAYTSEVSGVCESTLYRWLREFQSGGLPSLADKVRKDKNTSRFFGAYPKAAWLAAYLYLECKQSCRVAYEAIVRDPAQVEVPPEDLPSYETVRSYLKSMPASLVVYARLGKKAYRERMSPFLSRGFTDVYANQVWIGDTMISDEEGWNDTFDNVEWGEPLRVRLDAMLDYRSRMFVGASWCWEGSSRSLAATMLRGITRFGPPDHLYLDNGKPYLKAAKGARPSYMMPSPLAPKDWRIAEIESIESTGFLARLGIAVTHCIPYSPQSKAIERAFRTLHERFDKVWPTYTSGSPFTRPESTEVAMMKHRRLLRAGRLGETKHPPISRIIALLLGWFEEYADTPHGGEGMEGCTPRQVYEANLNPDQKPIPEYSALALLMAEHETRLVHECEITLKKSAYVPVDQSGWASMHEYNEREVVVAYDPVDLDHVAVLDRDGMLLAWLEQKKLTRFAPWDPATQAQIADSMAIRRRLEKGTRQALSIVTAAAKANGAQSPLEAMVSRLQLSAGETGADIITQKPRLRPDKKAHAPASAADLAAHFLEGIK